MKLLMYCLLAMLWPVANCYAQSPPVSIRPLTVGDTVPDLVFENVINSPVSKIRLSDLKGKLVILDFWATWCSPCIKGLFHLNEMQKEFKGAITVLPVNCLQAGDTRKKIITFFKENLSLQFPSILDEEKHLLTLFPHRLIPHCIVISQEGTLLLATKSEFLTRENITSLLKGNVSKIPTKQDVLKANTGMLLLNREGAMDKLISSSQIIGRLQGITGIHQVSLDDHYKLTVFNKTIPQLYTNAFEKPYYYSVNRILLEQVTDSSNYLMPASDDPYLLEKWKDQHLFCFELLIAKIHQPKAFAIMVQELNRHFGLQYHLSATLQMRKTKCRVLIRTSDISLPILDLPISKSGYQYRQALTEKMVDDLSYRLLDLPLVNGTEPGARVNFNLSVTDFKDVGLVKKELNKYGFDLVERDKDIEMIVLKVNNNE